MVVLSDEESEGDGCISPAVVGSPSPDAACSHPLDAPASSAPAVVGKQNVRGCGLEIFPNNGVVLTAAEATLAEDHANRVTSLKSCLGILAEGNAHPSLVVTLERSIHEENRRARAMKSAHPVVAIALLEKNVFQQKQLQVERVAAHVAYRDLSEVRAMKKQKKDIEAQLCKARRELREAQTIQEASAFLKSFTPKALGHESKVGGGATGQSKRFQVLNRIRKSVGTQLSAQQLNDWFFFIEAWDSVQLTTHAAEWGLQFAEQMHAVIIRLQEGHTNTLSEWMKSEWETKLPAVKVLQC